MTHPLTDEMCQDIYDLTYKADEMMRTAYDLGESKGRADMLEQVIDWLYPYLIMRVASISSNEIDLLLKEFKQAMRPQEES